MRSLQKSGSDVSIDPVIQFQKDHFMRNLFLMGFIQVFVLFNYTLLIYLTTMFEQIYLTGLISSASEMSAYAFSGALFEKLGVRRTYVISCSIASIGGALIIFYGLDHQESIMFPIFFFISKFGLSSSYNLLFVANSSIFEV